MGTTRIASGKLPGIFVIVLGLLFLLGAAWSAKNTFELTTNGVHAEGTVTDVLETQETERRPGQPDRTVTRYRYMVEFRDTMGTRVEFKDSVIDSTISHQKGDKVPVIYLRDDAEDSATIDAGALNWIVPAMLAFFGFSLLAGGIFAVKA
ncbi:MAG: DUF3592 domain-containing protein [Alphaproteobacteria bacterium]